MACVQLINALVSTPDDLDFRLHLRNEFVREGLNDPLQVQTYTINVYLCIYKGKLCELIKSHARILVNCNKTLQNVCLCLTCGLVFSSQIGVHTYFMRKYIESPRLKKILTNNVK